MSNKPAQKRTPVDIAIWIAAVVLVVAGLWANQRFSYIDLSLRLIGWLVLAGVVVGVILQSQQGRAFLEFAKESRTELRRVVWPNRQETVRTTLLVIGMIIVVGLIIWGIDSILLHVVGWLAGQRG